jgi:hypothetical protein
MAVVFGVAGLAYSAPKLLPVVEYVNGDQFWDTRNPTEKPDLVTLDMLKQTYLVPTQNVGARLPMQRHGWHEYGNYIGIESAIAIVMGLTWVFARRSLTDHWFGISLAVTTVMLFLLSLGEFSAYSPAVLTHYLPLFSSFRIPSRFSIPFVQFAALTIAWAMRSMLSRYALPRSARMTIAVACLAASAHLIYVNQWNLKGVFNQEPFDTSFHWMSGPRTITTDADSSPYTSGSPMLKALMADRSFFNCYESLQVARGAGADRPQVFDANPSARVSNLDFSPNRLTFDVKPGADDARVVLNQNWAPGWTTTAGAIKVGPRTELSTVTIPASAGGRYQFSFTPPGLYAGTALLILAMLATAWAWRRRTAPIFSVQPPR